MRRRFETLLLAALAVTLAGCSHQPETTDAASESPAATVTGVFTGSVTKGPTAPVLRAGASPVPAGVANAQVDIAAEDGTPLTSVVTDAAGRFSLSLGVALFGAVSSQVEARTLFDEGTRLAIQTRVGEHFRLWLDAGAAPLCVAITHLERPIAEAVVA